MATAMAAACPDATFGPWAGPSCRGGVDFTLLFELIWFSIVPAVVFIPLALWNVQAQPYLPVIACPPWLAFCKVTSFCLLSAAGLASLAANAAIRAPVWQLALVAATCETFAALVAAYSSYRLRRSSPRSSALTSLWLSLTILLDLAVIRTAWLSQGRTAQAVAHTISESCKIVCLVVENIEYTRRVAEKSSYSPEEVGAPLNRIFFAWIYPLFRRGYALVLSVDQLTPISADLKSDEHATPQSIRRPNRSLFLDLVFALPAASLVPMVPRLFLLGFTLAQPFLIHSTLNFLLTSFGDRNVTKGNFLVFGYALGFGGFALANALYMYLMNRLMVIMRSKLLDLVYDNIFRISASRSGDSNAATLMTIDADVAMRGFEEMHEIWASLLQIICAVGILGVYMSWPCIAPIITCTACFVASIPIVLNIGPAQNAWDAAVADRLRLANVLLTRLRDVRMLGLVSNFATRMQASRSLEISKSRRFRQLIAIVIVLCSDRFDILVENLRQQMLISSGLSPLATFAMYAAAGDSSGVFAVKAFTALNLIALITTPFGVLVQALPIFMAGLAALTRIQGFLDTARSQHQSAPPPPKGQTLSVSRGCFGWTTEKDAVQSVDLEVATGTFVCISGPVGSGKSTLLLGILGYVPHARGTVSRRSTPVSFCAQKPWMFSGSVRANIVCGNAFEKVWYDQVLDACALEEDLKTWEHRDLYEVGNDGLNLSGGQRQRIALARAIYARNTLVVLDDPLSGLDQASSRHVQESLFSKRGILRAGNVTVVVASNTMGLVNRAEHVILLAVDGTIARQGRASSFTEDLDNIVGDLVDVPLEPVAAFTAHAVPPTPESEPVAGAVARADLSRKTGDVRAYLFYAKATGRLNALAMILCCAACAFCYQFSVIWISWWARTSLRGDHHSVGYRLGYLTLITVLGGLTLAGAAWTFLVRMVDRSAANLHLKSLEAVLRTPSSYFDAIDTGVTLNRFNQDLRLSDYVLPLEAINTVLYTLICISQTIVICVEARYMAILIPFALVVLWAVQRFYLRTSRQLRLLDIEAKAPLYTNVHETIGGILTIQAFGPSLGDILLRKQRAAVNTSQQPIFLLYTVQRWLSLNIDLLVAILVIVLITLVTKVPSMGSITSLGTALVNLTSFSQYLTFLIKFWTSMENSLGAIARVKDFSTNTPAAKGYRSRRDGSLNQSRLSTVDGQQCDLVFKNVTAHYGWRLSNADSSADNASSGAPALDNINLRIQAGNKVAIIGRSGSGKSTLISSICRILVLASGSIQIGNIDISQLDQDEVQERLTCVTQAPLFIPDISLRDNLEPAWGTSGTCGDLASSPENVTEMSDSVLVDTLQRIGLWSEIQRRGGLAIQFEASSWSTGQLQLLSLARAVVKKRYLQTHPEAGWKIFLADEITSSVDSDTAAAMRNVIRQEFEDWTVIMIEHRLEGLKEHVDRIIEMSNGKILEDDGHSV